MGNQIHRRDILRFVPTLFAGAAMAGVARALVACTSNVADRTLDERPDNTGASKDKTPTDDDEFVPADGTEPIKTTGDVPPTVPNQAWEARASQVEGDQARLYGAVFTKEAPGEMVGKDRSHVPKASVALAQNGVKRVTVVVEHVMGKNGLDAGYVDAGPSDAARDAVADAARDATADAARDAAGDASRDAGRDAAVDAGPKPPDHYITTIYLRALVDGKDTVVGLWEFAASDAAPPTVQFTLPEGVTEVVAYEWCTLHGLWKASPLAV